MSEQTAPPPSPAPGRASRWGLYLPFLIFGLICLAWSGYWMVARTVVVNALERTRAEAAARGDAWTCQDQKVSGFPFRIEIRCSNLQLQRSTTAGVVSLATGPLVAIGQPQTPGHVIVQAQGPARAVLADGSRAELAWEAMEASHRMRSGELERFSLQARKPTLTLRPAAGEAVTLAAQQAEAHVRRNQALPGAMASDVILRVGQLASGHLDALFGDANPADAEFLFTVSRADILMRGLTPTTIEQWRLQAGKVDVTRAAISKGIKKLEAKGALGLDEQRRVAGRVESAIANIDQIAGIRLRGGAMDLMSALSGRPANGSDGMRPLPALDLRQGRVALGPLTLPGLRLDPLY